MSDKYTNKVIYNGTTLIDLTGDTVQADKVLSGYSFHDKSGATLSGACTYDANTQDANASASEILVNKTAYVAGSKVTGSMANNGGVTGTISTKAQEYTIATGFHDGSGKVKIDDTEQAKIIATNIKSGVQILGVEGTYTGEAVTAQAKTVTPSASVQTILPDSDYDYLSQVTVNAIPYTAVENQQNGLTVTIG